MEVESLRARRIGDLVIVVLALLSVGLLVYSAVADLNDDQQRTVFWIDLGICIVFLSEFLGSWRLAGWQVSYLWRNWYDLISMIPAAYPPLVDHGTWTWLLWGLVILARVGRAADRLVGERVFAALTRRVVVTLVDTIRFPITVAVLEEVAAVLQAGRYTENLAAALHENEQDIKAMVRETLKDDPLTGRIKWVPFHDQVVDTVSTTTMRVIYEVLNDPRTEELIADVLRENILQLRTEIRAHGYGSGRGAAAWSAPDPAPSSESSDTSSESSDASAEPVDASDGPADASAGSSSP
jgi:voltage-gated potassium channel